MQSARKLLFAFICFLFVVLPFSTGLASSKQIIIAYGDSLTEGYCSNSSNYPFALDTLLSASGRQSTVVQCGLGGELSHHAVGRLSGTMKCNSVGVARGKCQYGDVFIWDYGCVNREQYSYLNGTRPDAILIWLGANDAIHRISPRTTTFNLKRMVQISRENKITPVLATLTPNFRRNYGYPDCETDLAHYNIPIRSLAGELNVPLADQCAALNDTWRSITCDGLHPTPTGDQYIAQEWLRVLPPPSLLNLAGMRLLLLH